MFFFLLIRRMSYVNEKNLAQDDNVKNLYPVLDSLNQSGCTPWKINEDILDIMTKVSFFLGGGDLPFLKSKNQRRRENLKPFFFSPIKSLAKTDFV